MPTLTYDYVYFASGPHSRQPRTPAGPGGFSLLRTIAGGTLTAGDSFVVGAQPSTQLVNGHNYIFGFVSVSGGTNGGFVSTDPVTPPPAVTVGTADIVVLVLYVPTGGGGTGGGGNGSGATIDSFNQTTGALFDDTFVTVSPDHGNSAANFANKDGYVDTSSGTEIITALSPTSPTRVDFVEWVILGGASGGTVHPPAALTANKDMSLSALAMYKVPPPPDPATQYCNQVVAGINSLIDNGVPGLLLTESQLASDQAALEQCVREHRLTQAFVTELLARYEAYAHDKNHGPHGGPIKL